MLTSKNARLLNLIYKKYQLPAEISPGKSSNLQKNFISRYRIELVISIEKCV